ncbi:hypothetical protein QE408_002949 [Agrobacterium larrymoorei]|uniref:Uncharacterized protein n=1 Tax=Agrobacterium larrymoorei TaxID=160699 RepID=A0ABU0ULH0_9HYPH|nr:hypothetical protein [Agrobacterium larrymoorei]
MKAGALPQINWKRWLRPSSRFAEASEAKLPVVQRMTTQGFDRSGGCLTAAPVLSDC